MTVLACDPGITGTGLAFLADGYLPIAECIYAPGKMTPQEKAENIARRIRSWIELYAPKTVVCEDMQYEDSDRGNIAAKKGLMLKTEYLIGVLGGICLERNIPFILVPVSEWKGSTPKDIVWARACRNIGCELTDYTSHAQDAIALGIWYRKCVDKLKN